jgi:hypothetical protein
MPYDGRPNGEGWVTQSLINDVLAKHVERVRNAWAQSVGRYSALHRTK